jgi:hypothetical protein
MNSAVLYAATIGLAVACHGGPTQAADFQVSRVSAGGTDAALLRPAKPRASIILLSGGDGRLAIDGNGDIGQGRNNQLVRTREAYAARGFAVLVPNRGYNLSALVAYMAQIKRPVTVVGTSRGTQRAAQGIAAGARPDRLVLTSGFLSDASGNTDNVMNTLGSPAALPPTLIVHHRADNCHFTQPAGVAPFIAWAQKRARLVWLDGGNETGDPCRALSHHGFYGIDGRVVSTVAGFAAR